MTGYIFYRWTNKAKTTFGSDHKGDLRFAMDEPSFMKHWEPQCAPATIDPTRKAQLISIAKAQVKGLAQARKIATIAECLARPTLRMIKVPKAHTPESQAKRIFTLISHDDYPPRGFWISNGKPRLIDGHCMSVLPARDETIWRFPALRASKITIDITNPCWPLWEKTYSTKAKRESTWESCEKGWEQASELFAHSISGQDIAFDIPPELTKQSLSKVDYRAYFYKQKIAVINHTTGEMILEIHAPDLNENVCVAFNLKTLARSKAKRIAMHRPYSENHTSIKVCRIEHKDGSYGLIMPITWSKVMLEAHNLTQGT